MVVISSAKYGKPMTGDGTITMIAHQDKFFQSCKTAR